MRRLNVHDLAAYIVNTGVMLEHPVTNSELQNILYILNADYKEEFNLDLFFPGFSRFSEAFGWIVPSVYTSYCLSAGNKITRPSRYRDVFRHGEVRELPEGRKLWLRPRVEALVCLDHFDLLDLFKEKGGMTNE